MSLTSPSKSDEQNAPDQRSGSPTEDELDKDQLDQLHNATLKASDACFEIKKLCATVVVPTAMLVALLSDRTLNEAVFLVAMAVVVTFWMADSVAFYYQRRLRNAMAVIWRRRAARCNDYRHIPAVERIRPLRAPFDGSMAFYFVLLAMLSIGLLLFKLDVMVAVAPTKP